MDTLQTNKNSLDNNVTTLVNSGVLENLADTNTYKKIWLMISALNTALEANLFNVSGSTYQLIDSTTSNFVEHYETFKTNFETALNNSRITGVSLTSPLKGELFNTLIPLPNPTTSDSSALNSFSEDDRTAFTTAFTKLTEIYDDLTALNEINSLKTDITQFLEISLPSLTNNEFKALINAVNYDNLSSIISNHNSILTRINSSITSINNFTTSIDNDINTIEINTLTSLPNINEFHVIAPTDPRYKLIDFGCNCLTDGKHIKNYNGNRIPLLKVY